MANGTARTTIADIAREAGVTKMTVSNVLNGRGRASVDTAARIQAIAKRLHFMPDPHARALAGGWDRHSVAVFSNESDLGVLAMKLEQINRLLTDRGYATPQYGVKTPWGRRASSIHTSVELMCRQRPCGIVFHTTSDGLSRPVAGELQRYVEAGGNVAMFDYVTNAPFDSVVFDRADGAARAARHLLELGHRHIALSVHDPADIRVDAVREVFQAAGTVLDPEWVTTVIQYEDGGLHLAERFLAVPPSRRPTAAIVLNDRAACAFVHRLWQAGVQSPRDVSLVCLDDTRLAQSCVVPLTTVGHPVAAIASGTVELLLARLAKGGRERAIENRVVRGELTVRGSTASRISQQGSGDNRTSRVRRPAESGARLAAGAAGQASDGR